MNRSRPGTAAALLTLALAAPGVGQTPPEDHSAHRDELAARRDRYTITRASYAPPDVTLLDAAGAATPLRALLDGDRPLALNFVFTTCTTICPVMTATFAQMRRELGPDAARLRMLSLSIDPEYDRPQVLERYARRYGAGEGWTFLTGDAGDVKRVLQAFAAYAGSKMNHRPITLLRRAGEREWVRIDGLAGGKDLAREVREHLLR